MGSKKQREYEFERYPKYKELYLKAFEKMIENRGWYCEESDRYSTDSRTGDESLHDRKLQGGQFLGRNYNELTPIEIMDWWID